MLEILIILLLILVNGLFAMSEIAIVSARKPRLQQRAEKGNRNAQLALTLAEDPEDFLSTVQIGITLIGIVAGVFGGATLAQDLTALLETVGLSPSYSGAISATAVVSLITYLSLVVGELVPKNLALQNAERVATAVAPFMYHLSRLVYPLVKLLSVSTQFLSRILGIKPSDEPAISDEEIAIMMQQGAQVGIFDPEEPEMIKRIFRLSDRQVSSLMTPRREIAWVERHDTSDTLRQKITDSGYSRFPVADGDLDQVVGYIEVKDLLKMVLSGAPFDLNSILRPPLYVPETMLALDLLERLKEQHAHMALVFDEYGGLEGLITSNDLLEAIVGDIDTSDKPLVIHRQDNSLLVDGMTPIEELLELLQLDNLPRLGEGYFQTVGGLMLSVMQGIPSEGEYFDWHGYRFEVIDMDRLRVDKVLITPYATSDNGNSAVVEGKEF